MIRFDIQSGSLASRTADCLAIGLFDEDRLPDALRALDAATGGRLKALRASGDLPTRPGETQLLLQLPGVRARRVLVVGLGKRADFNRRQWRKAVGAALGACIKGRSAHLLLALERPDGEQLNDYYFGRAIADLAGNAVYRVNDLKSGRHPPAPALRRVSVTGVGDARAAVSRGLAHGAAIGGGQALLRDLGNLPGNVCTPRYLADQARAIARASQRARARVR
jgi:leucyl aminopeptidase